MIVYNNKEKLEELQNIDINEYYILADFDGTFTLGKDDSSWSSIFKNSKVSESFIKECIEIYNNYHKYEIDNNLDINLKMEKMTEWYQKNIQTLIKYEITEEIINYASNNTNIIKFRDGAKELLSKLNQMNVPVIIISAGVGNIIEQFLIHNKCKYENIYIVSNFLEYENGKIVGVQNNNLIHPLNKNEVSLSSNLKEKIKDKKCLLLGDNIMDIYMHNSLSDVIKVGFLDNKINENLEEFTSSYDIVCTENTAFYEILKI